LAARSLILNFDEANHGNQTLVMTLKGEGCSTRIKTAGS